MKTLKRWKYCGRKAKTEKICFQKQVDTRGRGLKLSFINFLHTFIHRIKFQEESHYQSASLPIKDND